MRVVLLAVVLALAGPGGAAAKTPDCFGAAARDAARPCENPRLAVSATPSPRDAPLLPALECTFVRYKTPHVCAFGIPKRRARGSIALLGDSHAPAWRAAADRVARSTRRRGLTLARSSCPFAFAARRDVNPERAEACNGWIRGVLAWFRRHPEVDTVLFVNSTLYDFAEDPVDGYRRALDALPPSVRRIVVIRDNPIATPDTLPCVARALRREERPDRQCALPRAQALPEDPAAAAATQLEGDRGRTIDLTPFFCDDALCFPVVGGALVFKDTSHITQVFSRTLGPYLAREFAALGARASAAPA